MIREFFQVFFDVDSDVQIDLFERFPKVRSFFRERRLHAAVRTVGDITFTFIIVAGLFGPQEPERNCILFLSWGLWWPSVVLSWFFLGRMWCGFCPFPGIGRIMQKMGLALNLPLPKPLKKYGVYWSVILLAIIIWVEESTGVKTSPRETALLLLAILGGATICAVLFPKQAWCRYLCPMGRITGVAATLSLTEFRPDHSKCQGCPHFGCKRGRESVPGCPVYLGAFNVRNNLYCLVCGHCLKACDRNSPQLRLRSPFKELIINKGRFITCSYIIPFLMGSQLARFFFEGGASHWSIWESSSQLHGMLLFSLLLALFFCYSFFLIRLGAYAFGITEDELFGRFSPMVPALLPVAFGGELIYRLRYALETAPDFLPTVGRQFSLDLEWLGFTFPGWLSPLMSYAILGMSTLAGVYVIRQFAFRDFSGLVSPVRVAFSITIVLVVSASYLMLI